MAKTSYTSFDKDISMTLEKDEELLLRCAPQKASFVLSKSVTLMPFALIWLCFDGFAITMITKTNVPPGVRIFLFIFFAIHLLPVWIWIYSIVKAVKTHKYIEYAMTNERIIVRDKFKLTSYYYSELSRVRVSVGLVDKIFKVGDIKISKRNFRNDYDFSSSSSDRFNVTLLDIANPHAIGDKLQQFIDSNIPSNNDDYSEDVEYESYYEEGKRDSFSKTYTPRRNVDDSYNRKNTYNERKDDEYIKDDYQNEFEEKPTRYTSKKKSEPTQKTEEDDYLDNIMDSIDKKEDFR